MVKMEISKNDDIDEGDLLAKEILHGIDSRMSEKIIKGNYGEMRTEDHNTDGYYIVEWDLMYIPCKMLGTTLLSMRMRVRWCSKQCSGIQWARQNIGIHQY